MKLKRILEESNAPGFKNRKFGDALPTMASIKAEYDAKQGTVTESDLTEGVQSNIMQKWGTAKVIQNDLEEFIDNAMDAGGSDLVEDIHKALQRSTKYAMEIIKQG